MKKTSHSSQPSSVDEYLAAQPLTIRKTLQGLRSSIMKAAPKAEEVISYQIPTYKYKGALVHFAAFKDHCSFFGASKKIMTQFEKELHPFKVAGTTIHFQPGQPLPDSLVQKIVKARIKENDEKSKAKTLK